MSAMAAARSVEAGNLSIGQASPHMGTLPTAAPGSVTSRIASIPNARLAVLQSSLETPPTTDIDSQSESELGIEADTESESLSASIVLVQATDLHADPEASRMSSRQMEPTDGEDEYTDAEIGLLPKDDDADVGTDEEEAEILRRVRDWAIDSHRQRVYDADKAAAPSGHGENLEVEADQTLTPATIAEEDDDDIIFEEIILRRGDTEAS
jgi:hypothetical protein